MAGFAVYGVGVVLVATVRAAEITGQGRRKLVEASRTPRDLPIIIVTTFQADHRLFYPEEGHVSGERRDAASSTLSVRM